MRLSYCLFFFVVGRNLYCQVFNCYLFVKSARLALVSSSVFVSQIVSEVKEHKLIGEIAN